MVKNLLLFLLSSLISVSAFAHRLSGVVQDSEGQPVPYATVYVENTTLGVVTDLKGEFFLELDKGNYNLVVSCLSYQKKTVPVEIAGNTELKIELETADVALGTVEVTADRKDPAYKIMEEVIKRKGDFVKQFDSYQCETYLKVSLEREPYFRQTEVVDTKADSIEKARIAALPDSVFDSSAEENVGAWVIHPDKISKKKPEEDRRGLNFIESFSTTYFDYPNKYKSIVHAYRDMTEKRRQMNVQGQFNEDGFQMVAEYNPPRPNPLLFYTDVSQVDVNFYKNLVEILDISDRPLVSPLSSTAWKLTYIYQLEDEFLENGRVIYKIKVTPRLQNGPYFEGHIYVVDGIWALKSVNLKVSPSTLGMYTYFQIVHNYERTSDYRWVLAREDYYYNAGSGRKRYYGNSLALHSNYQLDVDHPKNWFRNELRRVEEDARDVDSLYWVEHRPVTLRESEITFIHKRDSIRKYKESPEYLREQDSIYNKFSIWDPLLNGVGIRRREKGMDYFINPLISQIRPFGVGGYRHALGGFVRKRWENFNMLFISGELNYGFNNNDLRGNVRVGYTYNPRRFGAAYVKYGNGYSLVNGFETVTTVLSRGNYINKVYYGIGHEMEIVNGIFADVSAEFADRKPIDNLDLAEWSQNLFGDNNTPREFDPYRELLFDIKLRITPNQKYYTDGRYKVILGTKWPIFNVHYKKAIPGFLGSEIDFDFLEISVQDEFRPGSWGISRWSANLGRFLSSRNLLFTDFKYFRGSDPYFFVNPLAAMQLLGPTISTKNAYLRMNYLHDFGGLLLDKIPLINRTPLQSTVGAGLLLIEDGNFLHSEVYAGLQIPFTLWQQRFKFGAYYVTSYSTVDKAIGGQIKFGLTFFNPQTNQWRY